MSLELSLISYLRDTNIRGLFGSHITSDLIVEDMARITFESLIAADSSELGLIFSEVQKRTDNREVHKEIMDTFKLMENLPLSYLASKKVVKELESYVRWRKTTTQINLMAYQNLDSIIPISTKETEAYQKLSDAINFVVDVDDIKHTFNFSNDEDYERAKMLQSPDGKSFRSRMSLINNSLRSSGYVIGELAMFVAPPGVGKSTALCAEGVSFVSQDFKVLHYVLGDLSALDVCHKYISNSTKRSLNSVFRDSDKYMKTEVIQEMFRKVLFRVKGTYEFSVDDLCADARRMKDKFDFNAIIIDYDGNIRPDDGDKSLYEDGGNTYGKIRQLGTDLECTTLIGCQPKLDAWDKDILDLNSANNSSRKQHHVDTLVTASKPNLSIPLGILHIAKARSGETGRRNAICYLNSCATILEISDEERKMIKGWYKLGGNPDDLLRGWAVEHKGMNLAV